MVVEVVVHQQRLTLNQMEDQEVVEMELTVLVVLLPQLDLA